MNSNRNLRWSGNRKAVAEHEAAVRMLATTYNRQTWNQSQRKPKRQASRVVYREYILTSRWQKKRMQVFKRYGRICSVCKKTYDLHVHHKTYERLGNERLDDLCILCVDCHCVEHESLGYVDSLSREFREMFK